jgi:hypothetical protein
MLILSKFAITLFYESGLIVAHPSRWIPINMTTGRNEKENAIQTGSLLYLMFCFKTWIHLKKKIH